MSVAEWESLSWVDARIYLDGLENEGLISYGGNSEPDLMGDDLVGLGSSGFATRKAHDA